MKLASMTLSALLASTAFASMAAPPSFAPIQGAQPVYREIKEWVLACDNTRACFAKYVDSHDGSEDAGYLSIERDAGLAGAVTVTVIGADSPPNPTGLRLDGHPLPALAWTIDRKAQSISLRGSAAVAFVHAIRDGTRLAYSGAKDAPAVVLSGMTAALLAMDEDQGRLGGVTALVRTGPAPASAVPAAMPVPVVYAKPTPDNLTGAAAFAKAVRRAEAGVLKTHDCDPDRAFQDEAHALDGGNAIVILGCTEAAYQGTVLVFEAPRDTPAKAHQLVMPLEPPLHTGDTTNTDGEYTEGEWEPKTASFSESAKGRGLADCGSSTTWTYDGATFHLSQYSALERCGGGPIAGDWPTLYRTKVVNH